MLNNVRASDASESRVRNLLKLTVWGLGTTFASTLGAAETTPAYNVIELQAEASQDVVNDLFQAVLYVETNDQDAARLATTLNTALNDALATAKGSSSVQTRSGGYQTFPIYDRNQRLSSWRGRAELRLESRDFVAASRLVAQLQARFEVASMTFTVSSSARATAMDALTAEALAAFRGRSEIIRKALGAQGYRLRQVSLNASGPGPQPRPFQVARAATAVPAPDLEGGTTRLVVAANGAIELQGVPETRPLPEKQP
jgi:predicted secreted protein